jgi:DNA-binding transcriptional ArsR family regulator
MTGLDSAAPPPPADRLILEPEQAALLADQTRGDIVTLLAERPASIKELAGVLDKPKGTIGHHVKALEVAGMIRVVRTRKVRAVTEKFYGRTARTFVFPGFVAGAGTFLDEAAAELRSPRDGEDLFLTLRHARIPTDRLCEFAERLAGIAEEFAAEPPQGRTTYGMVLGIYPTDRPSLPQGVVDV